MERKQKEVAGWRDDAIKACLQVLIRRKQGSVQQPLPVRGKVHRPGDGVPVSGQASFYSGCAKNGWAGFVSGLTYGQSRGVMPAPIRSQSCKLVTYSKNG